MKKLQISFIILFFAIIAIPLLTVEREHNVASKLDNRELEEFPTSEEFTQIFTNQDIHWAFEDALSDRIGFRNGMLTAYTVLNDKLFHEMVHPTYTYGQDNYVFFKMPVEEFDEDYGESYAQFVNKIQTDCEAKDITFLYWLNPGKNIIYEEELPKGVSLNHEEMHYILNRLDEMDVNYFYSKDVLLKAKESAQIFDVQYDAGHWNDTGAFAGTNGMLKALNDLGEDVPLLSLDDFDMIPTDRDTLPVSYFQIQDQDDFYELKEQTADVSDKYDEELGNLDDFTYFENPANPDGPSLLFFRGSYMAGRPKFVIDQFSSVACVGSYDNIWNYQHIIDVMNPDIVVFECAEYVIYDQYFPKVWMDEAVTNE